MQFVLIEIKNLVKKYGGNIAVNDISFTVQSGKIYGFLGPNGAGKSTTMNIISGCLAATEGTVLINGQDIFAEPVKAKKYIGYLPEQPPLYIDMTPIEYLRFVGEAKGLRARELELQIAEVVELTKLAGMEKRLIKNLSKGYRQRVGIAQAMLGDPQVIILDEPTVGLDPKQILEIRELIRSLSRGRTVILSSHILSEISAVCDHVMIISKGKLVANDPLQALEQRYTGDNILHIKTRAPLEDAQTILSDLDGALSVDCTDTEEEGVCLLTVRYPADIDLREAVYRAFCKTEYPMLSMLHKQTTLEDIFLSLTEGGEDTFEENKLDNSDENNFSSFSDSVEADKIDIIDRTDEVDKPDETDKSDESDESNESDDDDDYTPLFS